jgi:large subunit ribosomal protein LP1
MSEAAVSYATLILADAEVEVSAEKILAITKAAGVTVEPVRITTTETKPI